MSYKVCNHDSIQIFGMKARDATYKWFAARAHQTNISCGERVPLVGGMSHLHPNHVTRKGWEEEADSKREGCVIAPPRTFYPPFLSKILLDNGMHSRNANRKRWNFIFFFLWSLQKIISISYDTKIFNVKIVKHS